MTLREEGHRGRIALLGDEATLPFGRPPLSKGVLRGEEDLGDWYVRPADWYDRNDVQFRADSAVARVDTDARRVLLGGGEAMRYDHVVLCTGGRARKPDIPGIRLPGVHVLRTVTDCATIRAAARPGARAVVVGMGFIGSEVAASLRQLGVAVTAVVSGASPLESVLGREVGAAMARIHREHGVELIPADRVVCFEGSGSVERVVTGAGVRLGCDFVVVGTGLEPDLASVTGTAIACDNGILVDGRCRTTVDGIFAAGDVANHLHPLFGRVRVEHYNNAERMGGAVARSILGDNAAYGYVHSFWSDQYEHKLEYVGHAARWDRFVVRGSVDEQRFVGFYVRDGVLRAAVGLNRGGDPEIDEQSELHACQELIARQAAVPVDVLEDERIDLRALLPRSCS